jgi:hypothetical protein
MIAAPQTPSYDYPAGAEQPSLAGIEQAHARIRFASAPTTSSVPKRPDLAC